MRSKLLTQVMAGMLVAAGAQVTWAEDAAPAPAGETTAQTYTADPTHGTIGFRVQHLVISKVRGEFKQYEGKLQLEGNKLAGAEATIQATSIDTANADRDKHLRAADFLDVEKFPTLTFKSTSVEGDTLTGDLTLHGVTKSVQLKYTLNGPIQDPWGNTKVGVEMLGKISRSDFGLSWSKALETGGVVVGDEVELMIDMEFAKQ